MCDDDFDWEDWTWGFLVGSDREVVPDEPELDNDFYEPAPGEEGGPKKPGVRDNGDGTASFTGPLIGMGF
jgi:hypothetical protein